MSAEGLNKTPPFRRYCNETAGSRSRTLDLLAQHDFAAKACLCGRVDIHAYKHRVATISCYITLFNMLYNGDVFVFLQGLRYTVHQRWSKGGTTVSVVICGPWAVYSMRCFQVLIKSLGLCPRSVCPLANSLPLQLVTSSWHSSTNRLALRLSNHLIY